QWLLHEEKIVNRLIQDQQLDEALERLKKLLKYVESEQDMISKRSLRTYENTKGRIEDKITKIENL
ncbi:MAG: hypothetical protein ACTSUB_06890, partial [Candidatus Thorarchaeota archaeon]